MSEHMRAADTAFSATLLAATAPSEHNTVAVTWTHIWKSVHSHITTA